MFKTDELRVYAMFSNDRTFVIPNYQRKFIWDTAQWNQLLSDINLAAVHEIFLGTVVLDKEEENKFSIIDGQQRLTTFICMFIASIAYLKSELCNDETIDNKPSMIKNFVSFLIKDNGTEKRQIRLLNENNLIQNLCDEILKEEIEGNDAFSLTDFIKILDENNDNKYAKAIRFFLDYFKKRDDSKRLISDFTTFYNKLRNIRFVNVETDNTADAYTVFETLNARGVQLTQLELLKAYLLKKTKGDEHFKSVKTKIEEIQTYISVEEQDNFLLHSVKCLYNYSKLNSRNIYRTITEKHSDFTVNEHVHFVDNLLDLSKIYSKYEVANLNADNDRDNLFSFCTFKNIKIYRPLFLALDFKKEVLGTHYYSLVYKLLFKFAVLNVINKTYSNTFDKDLSKAANKIYLSNKQSSILYYFYFFLRNKIVVCDKEKMKNSFNSYRYSNKISAYNNSARALIHILKYDYDVLQGDVKIDYETMNIEHILNDSSTEDYKTKFGNLLIVKEETNSEELKSKPYSEKRTIYLQSNIEYVKQFANAYEEFDETKCAQRSSEVENQLLERFSISNEEIETTLTQVAKVIKMNGLVLSENRFNNCVFKNNEEVLRILNESRDIDEETRGKLIQLYSEEIVIGKDLEKDLGELL